MKTFTARCCVLLAMACAAGLAAGPPAGCAWAETVATMPAPTGYVDDYASVLSVPAKTELEGLCREAHARAKAQIFLVTVKTLDGADMDAFANELFHKWGIGEKKTDRGVLLILAIKEHKRRIEVGYGFEGILNDAKAGDIGREMVPALQASNYDEAARIGVRDVATIVAADSHVTLAGLSGAAPSNSGTGRRSDSPPPMRAGIGKKSAGAAALAILSPLLLFGVFGLIGLIVVVNIRRGFRLGGGGPGSVGVGGIPGGGIDTFNSGSGRFTSGIDTSSSTSDSFGGGGGGDSGGGGAGGSW
jgi:uncharacterized protein